MGAKRILLLDDIDFADLLEEILKGLNIEIIQSTIALERRTEASVGEEVAKVKPDLIIVEPWLFRHQNLFGILVSLKLLYGIFTTSADPVTRRLIAATAGFTNENTPKELILPKGATIDEIRAFFARLLREMVKENVCPDR